MTTKQEIQPKGQWLSMGLLVGAVIVLALSVGLGARTWQVWQNPESSETLEPNSLQEKDESVLEKVLAEDKKAADALKEKNLLAIKPPKQNPIQSVSGCLGNEAIINGKAYKVGDKVGDAEILAVEADRVKIRWEGKESYLAPMASDGGGSSDGGDGGGSPRSGPRGRPGGSSPGERPSPEQMKEMKEKMKSMKDMPPEAREALMMEMRSR